jgi:hypothetical protein
MPGPATAPLLEGRSRMERQQRHEQNDCLLSLVSYQPHAHYERAETSTHPQTNDVVKG